MNAAKIFLVDELGPWGLDSATFLEQLRAVKEPALDLHINSPGGCAWTGLGLYNSLRDWPGTVNVIIDGLAASAASVVAMAGDRIVMNRASQLMIHEASGLCVGPAADMTEMASLLDRCSDVLAGVYAGRAGGSAQDWRAAMKRESWYSGPEAVAGGLADEAVGEPTRDEWTAITQHLREGSTDSSSWAAATQHLLAELSGDPFVGFSAGQTWTDPAAFGRHLDGGQLWSPDAAHTRGRRTPPRQMPARQRTTRARAEALLMHADQLINPRKDKTA